MLPLRPDHTSAGGVQGVGSRQLGRGRQRLGSGRAPPGRSAGPGQSGQQGGLPHGGAALDDGSYLQPLADILATLPAAEQLAVLTRGLEFRLGYTT